MTGQKPTKKEIEAVVSAYSQALKYITSAGSLLDDVSSWAEHLTDQSGPKSSAGLVRATSGLAGDLFLVRNQISRKLNEN